MPASSVVRARIDPQVKAEAEAVLSELGMTSSDAIRMLMIRIAHDRQLPLPLKVPNAALVEAMEEAEAIAADPRRRCFKDAQGLFDDLDQEAGRG